jgi:hypothetical protein
LSLLADINRHLLDDPLNLLVVEIGRRHGEAPVVYPAIIPAQSAYLHTMQLAASFKMGLIKDIEFAAVTIFNRLSFKGDPKRDFRDEQGVLLR